MPNHHHRTLFVSLKMNLFLYFFLVLGRFVLDSVSGGGSAVAMQSDLNLLDGAGYQIVDRFNGLDSKLGRRQAVD